VESVALMLMPAGRTEVFKANRMCAGRGVSVDNVRMTAVRPDCFSDIALHLIVSVND